MRNEKERITADTVKQRCIQQNGFLTNICGNKKNRYLFITHHHFFGLVEGAFKLVKKRLGLRVRVILRSSHSRKQKKRFTRVNSFFFNISRGNGN